MSRFSTSPSASSTLHVVEIKSDDVEAGLNKLLDKVKEVYGGEVGEPRRHAFRSGARGHQTNFFHQKNWT